MSVCVGLPLALHHRCAGVLWGVVGRRGDGWDELVEIQPLV